MIHLDGCQFSIFGVVDHKGSSINQGHYIAHIKEDGKWFTFDDTRVTHDLKLSVTTDKDAYMIFFNKLP